jgi:hypothetical protein
MKNVFLFLVLFFYTSFSKDYGIGLVYLAEHGPNSGHLATDSILIFQEPAQTSKHIATLSQIVTNPIGNYHYLIVPRQPSDIQNMIEFSYEVNGLPFDSINSTNTWVRVVYILSEDNIACKGWVKVQAPHTKIIIWKKYLNQGNLFFLPTSLPPRFYDKPNGNEVTFHLDKIGSKETRYDYVLHAIKSEGDWLQVLVVSPSDYCFEPTNPRKKLLWIRYLDDSGRPLVFYSPRGC